MSTKRLKIDNRTLGYLPDPLSQNSLFNALAKETFKWDDKLKELSTSLSVITSAMHYETTLVRVSRKGEGELGAEIKSGIKFLTNLRVEGEGGDVAVASIDGIELGKDGKIHSLIVELDSSVLERVASVSVKYEGNPNFCLWNYEFFDGFGEMGYYTKFGEMSYYTKCGELFFLDGQAKLKKFIFCPHCGTELLEVMDNQVLSNVYL